MLLGIRAEAVHKQASFPLHDDPDVLAAVRGEVLQDLTDMVPPENLEVATGSRRAVLQPIVGVSLSHEGASQTRLHLSDVGW